MSGSLIVIEANNKPPREVRWEGRGYPALPRLYELIICNLVERVQVVWDNRIRDCWVDEEGLIRHRTFNPRLTSILAPRWKGQAIVGTGVIWVPDPRKAKKLEKETQS